MPGVFHVVYLLSTGLDYNLITVKLEFSTADKSFTQSRLVQDTAIPHGVGKPIFASIACRFEHSCVIIYAKNGFLVTLLSTDAAAKYRPTASMASPTGHSAMTSSMLVNATFAITAAYDGYYFASGNNSALDFSHLDMGGVPQWTSLPSFSDTSAQIGMLVLTGHDNRTVVVFKSLSNAATTYDINTRPVFLEVGAQPVTLFSSAGPPSNFNFGPGATAIPFNSSTVIATAHSANYAHWTVSSDPTVWGSPPALANVGSSSIPSAIYAVPGANDTFILAWAPTDLQTLRTNSSSFLVTLLFLIMSPQCNSTFSDLFLSPSCPAFGLSSCYTEALWSTTCTFSPPTYPAPAPISPVPSAASTVPSSTVLPPSSVSSPSSSLSPSPYYSVTPTTLSNSGSPSLVPISTPSVGCALPPSGAVNVQCINGVLTYSLPSITGPPSILLFPQLV